MIWEQNVKTIVMIGMQNEVCMLPLFVFSSTMPFFLLLSFFDCAAGLAQLVQRLNAELEISGPDHHSWCLGVLIKITVK